MRVLRLVGLSLLLALATGACRSAAPKPANVLMIVVDTLRADRLGSYGYGKGLTPVLDRFADRGVRFEHAYASSSWTMPSVASILTSRLPSQHKISDFDSKLADSEVTIAESLTAAGFKTAGFTANWRLTQELGYGQGFSTWRGFLKSPGSEIKARGEILRTAALSWVDADKDGGAAPPRFLYLQYMEPHVPLQAPAPLLARFAPGVSAEDMTRLNDWARRFIVDPAALKPNDITSLTGMYDAEVAAVDEELGRLFDALEQRGVLEHTVVIVTADHGEEFLEHGTFGHGNNLFNTTVHVPLIIAGPGIPAGRVVTENVSLIDLAPTVLDLLGLKPESRFEGRSLAPLLRAAAPAASAPADIVLQLPRKNLDIDLRLHRDGLVRGAQKVLVDPAGSNALFDLAADPGEDHPQEPPAGDALQAALDAANVALASRQQPEAQKVVVDEATKEKLRALGYHP
jgi:arylsulfatase A-like enzyme